MRINQRSGPTRTLITDPPGPWHPTGGRQGARRGEAHPLTAGLHPPSLDPSGAAPPAPTGASWPSARHVLARPKTGSDCAAGVTDGRRVRQLWVLGQPHGLQRGDSRERVKDALRRSASLTRSRLLTVPPEHGTQGKAIKGPEGAQRTP